MKSKPTKAKSNSTLNLFESVIESFTIPIVAIELKGKISLWNTAAEKTFGWKKDEIIGKPNPLIPEDYLNEYKDKFNQAIQSEGLTDFKTRRKHKDGRLIDVHISTSTWRDLDGNVIGGIAQIIDITEKVLNEIKIEESEARYYSLFESIRDAILVADTDRNIISCNTAFTEIFGYPFDEIEGKKTITIYENEEQFLELGKALKDNFGDYPFQYTVNYKRKDGSVFPGETAIFYLKDSEGNTTGFIGLIRDITERKRAEKALRESEEKYRDFFMKDLTGDFLSTVGGKIVDCNPAYIKILGYESLEDIKNPSTTTFYKNPEDRNKLIELIKLNREVTDYEMNLIRKDGSEIFVVENIIGVFDEKDNLTHLRGYLFDITERKNAEERLKHVHSLLYSIRNINQLIVTEKNMDTLCQKSCEILMESRGYSGVWIGLTEDMSKYEKFFSVNTGDEFEEFTLEFNKNNLPKCFDNLSIENPIIKSDSVKDYCKNCLMLKRREGYGVFAVLIKHLNYIYGVIYIITNEIHLYSEEEESLLLEVAGDLGLAMYLQKESLKKEEAENRFRSITQSANDAIISADSKGIIIGWNPGAEKMFGYPEFEIINQPLSVIIPDKYRDSHLAGMQRVISGGEHHVLGKTVELHGLRKDGQIFPIEFSLSEWESSGNKFYAAIIRDITERKFAEEEIIQAKEKAERADKLKSEFLAQMSHEIRSPLYAVLSLTSIVREETSHLINKELEMSYGGIESASKRIIRTIDSILNMSELQLGTYQNSKRKIDLAEVLKHLVMEYTSLAQSKKLELRFNYETKKAKLVIDEYALNQIFANLIDNAIKYTQKGFVEIRLRMGNKDQYIVEVEDSGIGISGKYLPELFTPFSQEVQGYSRKFEGNGLGMALVKKYCELINADISVKSKRDVGTTFTIMLNHTN